MLPPPRGGAEAETVDVGELARTVARSWRTVVAGALVGLAAAAALVLFFPARWGGVATVLLRNANDPTGSILSRFGIAGDVGGSMGGGALGNVLKSPMETELQILGSRDVLGEVVDSLGLQARVLAPRGTPSRWLLVPARHDGSFKRRKFTFERRADGSYAVSGADTVVSARPGQPVRLPIVGTVTIAAGPLPERFRIQFEDRQDAITRLAERLDVDKKGGEVAELDYAGPDSVTASEVPNAAIAVYLERRRTIDRGLNQRRYEFLLVQADSTAVQLASAEDALRREQERSGVFDPELSGKAGVEGLHTVREQLGEIDAERVAITQVVDQVERGSLTPRQLAAFPSFLKSPAINSLLSQMSTLETERARLLERRTERDPEVTALTRSIKELEDQLLPIGRSYKAALERQSGELVRQEREIEARMAALPGQAEGNLARQREVKRLSQTMLGLQAQILDARLAAIGEGGQVRQIDVALAPKRPRFPRPLPTFVVGGILGLIAGAVWAIARGAVTSRISTPTDAERVAGLPTLPWAPGRPLLLGPGARGGTILVLPVGTHVDAGAVARQLADHARERGQSVVVVDLTGASASAPAAAGRLVTAAEAEHQLVVVAAPALDDRRTAAVLEPSRATLLVARARRVRRAQLADVVGTLARLAIPCLGVVLADESDVSAAAAGVAVRPLAETQIPALTAARDGGARG